MDPSTPKISVLTPLYHTNPLFLREMIESILAQTCKDFEFILLNDSPDNGELKKTVESYHDPRIVYIENETNIGISDSRNKLIDLARGEYIAVSDHDDISLPTRFEKQAAYLDAHPQTGVVSCNLHYFPKEEITRYPTENLAIKRKLMQQCCVAHPASMIRKSVLVKSGIRYEERYSPAEDYMLWIQLLEHTMFHNLPEVLLKYRFHDDNTTNRQLDKMIEADALIKCFAYAKYPFLLLTEHKPRKWWRLFFIIPLI